MKIYNEMNGLQSNNPSDNGEILIIFLNHRGDAPLWFNLLRLCNKTIMIWIHINGGNLCDRIISYYIDSMWILNTVYNWNFNDIYMDSIRDYVNLHNIDKNNYVNI